MIRVVDAIRDTKAITDIYNGYVKDSTATFETEPVLENVMFNRIKDIASQFPYLVYEVDGEIAGYCYVHTWKARAAYRYTVETTVYVSPRFYRKGIGKQLMIELIRTCCDRHYHAMIACITEGNDASIKLHQVLGFKQVSHFEKVGIKFGQQLDVVDYELLLPFSSPAI
jgi:L-amino acid N-acyltransferase YncA